MPPQEDRPKTKKPANTAFKQQRLKAWQPILTPKTVLPTFFAIGAVFIPLGIGLFIASEKVHQVVFDYTRCQYDAQPAFANPNGNGPIEQWRWDAGNRTCTIQFKVDDFFNAPVFLYYRLTNFYQNHRRYVKSFNADQLKGNVMNTGDKKFQDSCNPLDRAKGGWVMVNGVNTTLGDNAQFYPCGLIANSMFSDTISNLTCIQSDATFTNARGETVRGCGATGQATVLYTFEENGIAWPSDRDRYAVSTLNTTDPAAIPTTLVPPPMWRAAFPQWANGYNSSNLPDLHNWERFQVWMRTAGLPTFRKLYGRNNGNALAPGIWEISIKDTFPVENFSGTKSIVISTVSIIGGKNPFLGVAYMTVGSICWLLGIAFLLRHMIKPRKLGDHTYLSWNQPQNREQVGGERSSLMSSGR